MDGQTDDEALSQMEWKIEQEKMKLERERIALERERLEAMRERVKAETALDGRMTMRMSSVALCSIICLLVGGIVGAFSMSMRHDQRVATQERDRAARVQELVQSLSGDATVVEETAVVLAPTPPQTGETNEAVVAAAPATPSKTLQVKTVRPKGSDSGISLIVIQ